METSDSEPQPGTCSDVPFQNCGVYAGGNITATNFFAFTGNFTASNIAPVIGISPSAGPSQIKIKSPFRFNVPIPNPHYKGRRDTLKAIKKYFTNLPKNESSCWERMVAIVGLGGMGKTETAYKFAAKYRRRFPNVAWINAETEEIARRSFLELAQHFGIDTSNRTSANPNLVKEIYGQIDKSNCGNVLFIFDNAIQLNSGAAGFGIQDYLPTNDLPNGRFPNILITTRAHDWGKHIKTFDVGGLSEEESLEFFKSSFKVKSAVCNSEFQKLYDLMSGYPLVMNLATSQIDYNPNKDPITLLQQQINQYIDKVTKENNKLTSERISPSYISQYPQTLLSVWKLTVERICDYERGAEALKTLQILSFLKLPVDTQTLERILLSDAEYLLLSRNELQFRLRELIRVLEKFHVAYVLQTHQETGGGYRFRAVMQRLGQHRLRQEKIYRDDKEGFRCELGVHRLIQLVVRQETDSTKIIARILCYLTHLEDFQSEGGVNAELLFKEVSQTTHMSSPVLIYLGILTCQGNTKALDIFKTREPKTDAAAALWCSYQLIRGDIASMENLDTVLREILRLIKSHRWRRHRRILADISLKILLLLKMRQYWKTLNNLDGIEELLIGSILGECSIEVPKPGSENNFREDLDKELVAIITCISKAIIQSDSPKPQIVIERLANTWLAILGKLKYYDLKSNCLYLLPDYWKFFWGETYNVFYSPDASKVNIVELVRSLWDRGLDEKLTQAVKILKNIINLGEMTAFARCLEVCLNGMLLKDERVQRVLSTFFDTLAVLAPFDKGCNALNMPFACSLWIKLSLMNSGWPPQCLQKSWPRLGARAWIEETFRDQSEKEIQHMGYCSSQLPEAYFTDYFPQFVLKHSSSKDQEIVACVLFCRRMMETNEAKLFKIDNLRKNRTSEQWNRKLSDDICPPARVFNYIHGRNSPQYRMSFCRRQNI